MKKVESRNKYDNSKKISPSVSHAKMQETAKLRGKNSGDGREQTYKINKKTGKKKHDEEDHLMKNEITGEVEQKDVKKEFEISSEKDSEKETTNESERPEQEERGKDPVGESEELEDVDVERDNREISHGSWRRPFKGDAEIVP